MLYRLISQVHMTASKLKAFLHTDLGAGMLLIFATLAALIIANSPLNFMYQYLLDIKVNISIDKLAINKPLLLWVNDGLMAIFFFHIGLELKREILEGELSSTSKIMLPAFAAIGGMIAPALIYTFFNWDDAQAMRGWAIPAATDIAFALGILGLLGTRVPVGLKIFLVSLAIFDDMGAIIIIALFYTSKLSVEALISALFFLAILITMNRMKVVETAGYLFFGALMWIAVLKSGVHATLAGVLIAMCIPLKLKDSNGLSPAKTLEHNLHTTVKLIIVPVFAFANAGVYVLSMNLNDLISPIPVGIALGLFLGKQAGVFGFAWLALKLKLAQMPDNVNYTHIFGAAVLCGIGFTMSLFIASLAFEESGTGFIGDRIGILLGSLISAVVGYYILHWSLPKKAA